MTILRVFGIAFLLAVAPLITACEPEVGSKEWCEKMKQKPKGDWSANEAAEFTKSCII